MEIKLIYDWKYYLDFDDRGEANGWNLASRFPKDSAPYPVPMPYWAKPFQNAKSAWLLNQFQFSQNTKNYTYLTFFGADKAKVFLNGELIGCLKRSAGKQFFEISRHLQENNDLIIKFEDITEDTAGLWKYVYIIENTTVPSIAKASVNHTPKWVDSAHIYSIYTRNFSRDGSFKSVKEQLFHLRQYGFNTLWFLPIHPVGQSVKKGGLGSPYAIQDYYEINPELGNKEDFKCLVKMAHQMGLRVIIDLVINHTAKDSVMLKTDPMFYKKPEEQRAHLYGWEDVLELDYQYAPTREYIMNVMQYWVKEFGIDGYRCDVAALVPISFWEESIAKLRKIRQDILMLAEADEPELHLAGFDLTYDFNYRGILEKIDRHYYPYSEINEYINTQFQYFPQNSKRLIYLENHDTTRASSTFSRCNLHAFITLKFFTPGVPLTYNGEECLIKERPSLFDKDTIPWDKKDNDLSKFYKSISLLKKRYQAFNEHFSDNYGFIWNNSHYKIFRTSQGKCFEAYLEASKNNVLIKKNGKDYYKN